MRCIVCDCLKSGEPTNVMENDEVEAEGKGSCCLEFDRLTYAIEDKLIAECFVSPFNL